MPDPRPLRVRPGRGLHGTVTLPGDKSLSHRALLLASLSNEVSRIRNCLIAGVTEAMLDCLTELGVGVRIMRVAGTGLSEAAEVSVRGCGLRDFTRPARTLNCRGSATTMRLMAGVLAGQSFESVLDGNDRLRMRPMNRIVEPLREKGARIRSDGGNAPLVFLPAVLRSSEHHLSVASAQVKSCLLLAGLYSAGPTTVSEPHRSRDHTERMLRELGVPVDEWEGEDGRSVVRVEGRTAAIPSLDMTLGADPSSAAFLTVAGLIVPDSVVELPGVCLNPGRTGLYEVLSAMGADLAATPETEAHGESLGTVSARSGRLEATEVRGEIVTRMIDEFPILAVAATQAHGVTVVRDAAELRLKESDRIQVLADQLNRMGAGIETLPDGFVVRGPVRLTGAEVYAMGDHRLAMGLAVAGLIATGSTIIHGWEVLKDSFPSFPHVLRSLGADIEW